MCVFQQRSGGCGLSASSLKRKWKIFSLVTHICHSETEGPRSWHINLVLQTTLSLCGQWWIQFGDTFSNWKPCFVRWCWPVPWFILGSFSSSLINLFASLHYSFSYLWRVLLYYLWDQCCFLLQPAFFSSGLPTRGDGCDWCGASRQTISASGFVFYWVFWERDSSLPDLGNFGENSVCQF